MDQAFSSGRWAGAGDGIPGPLTVLSPGLCHGHPGLMGPGRMRAPGLLLPSQPRARPRATDAQQGGDPNGRKARGVDHKALYSKRGRKGPVPGGGWQSLPVGNVDPLRIGRTSDLPPQPSVLSCGTVHPSTCARAAWLQTPPLCNLPMVPPYEVASSSPRPCVFRIK